VNRSSTTWSGCARRAQGGGVDQTVLFIFFLTAMLAGWFGGRRAAMTLLGIALVFSVADFFHHATSALTLSF
jgi:hypothetical protein